uniref:DUF7041 domain-containing protein n=1 Tax=Anopheles minimus TaxID=112268 RepID=A0A182W3Y3_9DIPT
MGKGKKSGEKIANRECEVEQDKTCIMSTEKDDAIEATRVAKVHFPEFDADDIETWFVCLEAAFCVSGIRTDSFKYNAIIVGLGNRAKFFHTAIQKCNASESKDKYETLKAAVVAYFRPSENQRLTHL